MRKEKIETRQIRKIQKLSYIFLLVTIISMLYTSIFASKVYADSDSSQTLNNVTYNINVNSDASMDVEEMWNIKIEETNTLFKQFNIDSSKYSAITNGSVSVISNGIETKLTDSNEYAYHVPEGEYYFLNRGEYYEVAWGTGLGSSSGTQTYKIKYHVTNAVAKYNDVSELYWKLFGSDFDIPIKKLTGTITLPADAASKEDIKVWGHTPDLNGNISVTDTNKISFDVTDNKAKKMIEVRVAMPNSMISSSQRTYNKDVLSDIISEETSWANDANATRAGKLTILGIISFIVFAVLTFVLVKNINVIRKTKKMKATQKYDYFRDLPRENATPLEAKFIIDNEYIALNTDKLGQIFMATLMNLSLKKAIKFNKTTKDNDTEIEIITDNIESITNSEDEVKVFEFVKNASNGTGKITTKELKKYITNNSTKIISLKTSFDKIVTESLLSKKILSKDGIKKRNSLWYNTALTGIFIFICYIGISFSDIIGNLDISATVIILAIIFIIIDQILGRIAKDRIDVYTQEGIDEQEKWKAFKKYMEDFSLLKEKDLPDLILWEKYLVYASAFGIAEKVIKQLKIVYPQYNDTEFTTNYTNMYILMNMDFTHSFDSVSSAMSSSFSSGSGAGGGFSGGGGGGRWRRRWRRSIDQTSYITKK